MGCRVVALLLGLLVVTTSAARAQETGSISGVIFDQGGVVVADATVKIEGERLPGGRTTTTSVGGDYRFLLLLPGTYTVEVEKAGEAARLGRT